MTGTHVLQLIDGLNVGGAELLLLELSSGLIRRGFRVSVGYSSSGPLIDQFLLRGVKVTRLPRLARIDPVLFGRMIRIMRSDPPQIVHTHLFKSDFHGRMAARLMGVPVVVSTLHSVDRWARSWPLGNLYGMTAKFADRLISVSDDVRNFHIFHTGVRGEKIVTIENGVDVSRYNNQNLAGLAVREEFNIKDSHLLFGIVGRLTRPKDHDTFLRAAVIILKEYPESRFLVVGDGPLRKNLEARAQNLGLLPALRFTGFRSDVPAILAALDVLVFSSEWEGLPVSLLEGMAAARPVVATAVGGIPAVVLANKTALLVAPGDDMAIAQACLKLASDGKLRRKMGQAAWERVSSHFSLDNMVDRTSVLYAELLQKRGLGNLIPPQVMELMP